MARKTVSYTITKDGRDKGKIFVLTEMPAAQAEAWAIRAVLAIMRNNPELPDGLERMGSAALASVGLKMLAGISYTEMDPLMRELMGCVAFVPDNNAPHATRGLMEDAGVTDIEEVMTRLDLKGAILAMHMDFLKAVAPLIFSAQAAAPGAPGTQST